MTLVRSFVSPEELHPSRVVTYEEVGALNLLFSAAAAETHLTNRLEPVHEVQTKAFREVVSQALLDGLRAKLGNASLLDRPILHRSQLLFAIRLVATHGDAVGGNK